MKFAIKAITAAAILAAPLAAPVVARADAIEDAIAARQKMMDLRGYYAGILAAMAKGQAEYDADLAAAAAKGLHQVATLPATMMFPAGSDSDALPDKTHALPKIWADFDGFAAKYQAVGEATAKLADVAGDGLDGVKAGLGVVFKACSSCHDTYRKPYK